MKPKRRLIGRKGKTRERRKKKEKEKEVIM